jgi:hypothetical protein
MLLLVTSKLSQEDLKKAAEDLDGYVKFVVDLEKEIITAGGKMHIEGKALMLKNDSQQKNLWGGGIDLETGQMDFDSMINVRPGDGNPSREVLSLEIRERMEKIVKKFI